MWIFLGKINRYKFAKRVYPEYVVLLLTKDKYITYDCDLRLIQYIKFNGNFSIFDKYKINYLVLDNLDITKKKEYDLNNYDLYLKKMIINKTICKNIFKIVDFEKLSDYTSLRLFANFMRKQVTKQ